MSNILIYVIGNPNHHNTLSMVRCYGEAGYMVDLIAVGKGHGCATKSKYLSHVWTVSSVNDIVPLLLSQKVGREYIKVIVCCSDEAACQMDINTDKLKKDFFFFHTEEKGMLIQYMDKKRQVELAKITGFDVPKSIIYNGEKNLLFDSFPCILKPLESVNGGKKIKICDNQESLNKELSHFLNGDKVLVQEFVKREEELVLVGLRTLNGIVIPAYIRKIRDNKGGTTYCEVKKIVSLDTNILNRCKDLVSKIGYVGLFGIELIHANGKYYFIEINLRNDATCYAIAKAGVNLPFLFIKDVIESEPCVSIKKEIEEIYSMVELKDLKFVLKGKVPFFKWINQLINAKCKYYYSSLDKKPFFYATVEILASPFCSIVRKI